MLAVNTGLVYLFVELFGIWYLFSQILAGILIATVNFFVYKKFIFKHSTLTA